MRTFESYFFLKKKGEHIRLSNILHILVKSEVDLKKALMIHNISTEMSECL